MSSNKNDKGFDSNFKSIVGIEQHDSKKKLLLIHCQRNYSSTNFRYYKVSQVIIMGGNLGQRYFKKLN